MNNGSLNIAIPELLRMGDLSIANARRDKVVLLQYGITDEMVNGVETDVNAMKEMRTDNEFLSAASEKVSEKDVKAGMLRETIRAYMVRAKNVFGADSAVIKGFGTSNLSRQTDNELVRTGRSVRRMCIEKFAQLSARGLTMEMLDKFGEQVQEFDDIIDQVTEAERARRQGTVTRNALALKIYNQLAEIFDYGKNYFRGKDELKYNDYVIFETRVSHKPAAGTGMLHGHVIDSVSTDGIEDALVEIAGTTLSGVTDEDGDYMINDVPVGNYTLKATAAGMLTATQPGIAVTEGIDTACNFELNPS